jgi:hypothetical protein
MHMMPKTITLWGTILIGAICAGLLGLIDLFMGADNRHPIFSEMWWCFWGSMNVYLISAPSALNWLKSKLRSAASGR